jgi:hypothetical protein
MVTRYVSILFRVIFADEACAALASAASTHAAPLFHCSADPLTPCDFGLLGLREREAARPSRIMHIYKVAPRFF